MVMGSKKQAIGDGFHKGIRTLSRLGLVRRRIGGTLGSFFLYKPFSSNRELTFSSYRSSFLSRSLILKKSKGFLFWTSIRGEKGLERKKDLLEEDIELDFKGQKISVLYIFCF